ncbi:hypothetical protein BXZ70DRAFT_906749 [Cristinia sonorae]|uniref:Uncharacterized protein n=1 Tax=Cristinia sonorae TaxID=1940300 RepID=A0A8K0UQL1_9AGAR|nr:hypothetical protein BXZ70DRAFT_906749 [Cristinia sonorae]
MFFSKFIVPAVALFSAASSVFATPIDPAVAGLVAKRAEATDVTNTCKQVYDSCAPHIANIAAGVVVVADATVAVDVVAEVNAILDIVVAATAELDAYVGLNVNAELDAIVAVTIDLIVSLFASLGSCGCGGPSLWARIDAVIAAYLAVLARINADICVHIGHGIPFINLNLFVTLKLILCAKILGLVNILL